MSLGECVAMFLFMGSDGARRLLYEASRQWVRIAMGFDLGGFFSSWYNLLVCLLSTKASN